MKKAKPIDVGTVLRELYDIKTNAELADAKPLLNCQNRDGNSVPAHSHTKTSRRYVCVKNERTEKDVTLDSYGKLLFSLNKFESNMFSF